LRPNGDKIKNTEAKLRILHSIVTRDTVTTTLLFNSAQRQLDTWQLLLLLLLFLKIYKKIKTIKIKKNKKRKKSHTDMWHIVNVVSVLLTEMT